MAPSATRVASDDCVLGLQTSALELKYERSTHLVDTITRDENMRRIRFERHILEDDNLELRELLLAEQDRSDKLEGIINAHLERAETAEAALQSLEATVQTHEQDIASLQAERAALKSLSTDTSKLVTEKLELTHELSRLKPEVTHLRAQVAANEGLLTEKLSLQRNVSELEIELENSKRDAQRAMAKRRNTMHEVAQEDELETLRKSHSKEKRLHERAKETITELQAEIDELKKTSQREHMTESKSAEQTAEAEVRTQELIRDLARERKERSRAERSLSAAQTDFDSTKAVLEDKLTQYKDRVRTLKDRLKEAEANLEEAQANAAKAKAKTAKSVTIAPPASNPQPKGRKRNANTIDPDATTLGTPGDAPAKRARKGASVGEKSSFSITPFLNRTASLAADGSDEEEEASKEDAASSEAEATPTAAAGKRQPAAEGAKAKKLPLQPVPASQQNIKKATKASGKPPKLALQVVEEDPNEDAASPVKKKAPAAPAPVPAPAAAPAPAPAPAPAAAAAAPVASAAAPKIKMRKSLAAFAAFTHEPEPEKKRSKARKLGGLGKTLFDEEDDVAGTTGRGAKSGGGLFGTKGFGAGFARGSLLLGGGSKRNDDGFVFSPLKRDRKIEASMLK